MTLRARTFFLVGGLALAVSGCGRGGGASDAGGGLLATGWKATDACAVLDKGAIGATLGSPVKTAKLDAVRTEGGGYPLYSQCVYKLADGRMVVLGAGQYTNSMTFEEEVADLRQQAQIIAPHPVDVPGLGKAAFWAKELNAVYAFLGDRRYLSATVVQPDFSGRLTPEQTQAADIALLRKAGM